MKKRKVKKRRWKKYFFEFASIFFAVLLAFLLTNWNENRRDKRTSEKILVEIKNGLSKDLADLQLNKKGHRQGIQACQLWRSIIRNQPYELDSLQRKYIRLTRDFTSLQNRSGYETLKARGLELIDNDSLRTTLISLYEYDYYSLRKLEEEYEEMQYQKSYFKEINTLIAPYFIYNEEGKLVTLDSPINLSKEELNLLLSYLMKIEINRNMIIDTYQEVEEKVKELRSKIEAELKQ